MRTWPTAWRLSQVVTTPRRRGCAVLVACAAAACGSQDTQGGPHGSTAVQGDASGGGGSADAAGPAIDSGSVQTTGVGDAAGGGQDAAGDGAIGAMGSSEAGGGGNAGSDAGSNADSEGGGGNSADAGPADGAAPFVCNQVTGLTLTREWYEAGFENGIDNARWQLKAMEHAYVTEWANPASTFWTTPIESACTQGSTSPDRLVFVVLSWTITTQADWETQITAAIKNFQTNYPAVRRIDLLTIIRGPNNMLCPTPPAAGETIQMPAALDAALAAVAASFPGFVFVGPKFEATSCADFNGGGPHLTTAGNTKAATTIAAYFATH